MTSRTLRVAAGATTTLALIASGIAASTSTATAVPTLIGAPCPDAYPAASLVKGQSVTGLTTAGAYKDADGTFHDSSETPEEFTGTYLGTVEDDSGDLLVFQLAGSRITKPNGEVDAGVWSGMSGSPVYAADGRLIGAVSYTFGEDGSSPRAGVTPAADMYAMLDGSPLITRAAAPKTVKLSQTEKSRFMKQGVPASEVGQLNRLDPTATISGGKGVKPSTVAAIARKAGMPAPRVSGSGGATQAREIPIVPGGNLAASDSFGSVASYGTGTATAICGDQVLAFGHPFNFAPSSKAIHGASTVTIQEAGAYSFKMANLGAPTGVLAKDGLNGILGKFGPVPNYPTITSTTNGRQSVSKVPNELALPFIAAMQAYRDSIVVLDQDASGEALISWTIKYTRASGAKQSFSRTQRYSSSYSIGEEATMDVAGDIATILANEFEDVKITSVAFNNALNPNYRAYKVSSVDVRLKGRWVRKNVAGGTVSIKRGKTLKVRVNLVKADKWSKVAPIRRTLSWKVPKSARGLSLLGISGNYSSDEDFEDEDMYEDEDMFMEDDSPTTFDQLIKMMKSATRNDSLTGEFMLRDGRSYARTSSVPSITSGDFFLKVNVRK